MNVRPISTVGVLAAAMCFGLAGCEREGPMERTGRQADDAIENMGEAVEDLGDEIQDTARDARRP